MSSDPYESAAGRSKLPIRDQVSSGGVVFRQFGSIPEVALISVGRACRWQLPKGTVDPGETPEITAIREVREETGLSAELLEPIDTIEYWYVGRNRSGAVRFHKRVHFYLLRFVQGSVRDHDREVNEARWIPLHEALVMLTFPNERDILAQARVMIERLAQPNAT